MAVMLVILGGRARKEHARRLTSNEWNEGVLVFESGDVVVRFRRMCGGVDRTIEHVYLSRADVEPGPFSPLRCRREAQLRIYYMEIAARQRVITVSESELQDKVEAVAAHLNEAKDRSLLAAMKL